MLSRTEAPPRKRRPLPPEACRHRAPPRLYFVRLTFATAITKSTLHRHGGAGHGARACSPLLPIPADLTASGAFGAGAIGIWRADVVGYHAYPEVTPLRHEARLSATDEAFRRVGQLLGRSFQIRASRPSHVVADRCNLTWPSTSMVKR